MQKREAKFQTFFGKWLKKNSFRSGAYELKQTTTDRFPLSQLKKHQREALLAVKHRSLYFKIPDVGYQNPFDCFCFYRAPAYVVIKYPTFFCLIDIDVIVKEKTPSLSASRAKSIADVYVPKKM